MNGSAFHVLGQREAWQRISPVHRCGSNTAPSHLNHLVLQAQVCALVAARAAPVFGTPGRLANVRFSYCARGGCNDHLPQAARTFRSHRSASPGNGNLPAGPDAASTLPFVFGTASGQPNSCRAAHLGSPDAPGLAEPGSAWHISADGAQAQRRTTHRSRARRGATPASGPSAAPGVLQCLHQGPCPGSCCSAQATPAQPCCALPPE